MRYPLGSTGKGRLSGDNDISMKGCVLSGPSESQSLWLYRTYQRARLPGTLLHHPEPYTWRDPCRGLAFDGREHEEVSRLTDRGHLHGTGSLDEQWH
jgi:hypothetical protein